MHRCRRRRAISSGSAALYTTAFLTLIFLIPGASQSHAQGQARARDPAGGPAAREARSRQLMTADITPARPSTERRVPFEQMREDFEQLQLANNRLSEMVNSGQALDPAEIRKDAAEVAKRAARLKKNLLLPEPKEGEKQKDAVKKPAAQDLKAMIVDLDALVKSFVRNPVFQQPNIVNAEGWARARRDLEETIILSEQLEKNAMSQASGRNP